MADPISITSLGITLCQALRSACEAWNDFDSDLRDTCCMIDGLEKTLKKLQDRLQAAAPDHVDVTYVQDHVQSCRDGIQSLQHRLNKMRRADQPSGSKQTALVKVQQGIYPFKKPTLEKLRRTVSDLQHRLGLALQVYQMYVNSDVRERNI